jgi:Spy/CpxP family protein refolding chaperone
MKHTIRLLSILTASGVLLAGSIGCEQVDSADLAEDEGADRVAVSADRHGGPPPGQMLEALGLDEAQREQATTLRASMERDLQPLEQQLQEKDNQLRAAWAAESPDRATILELGSQIDAIHQSMRDRQTQFRVAMNGLLTDEQRARMAEHGPGRGPRGERGRLGQRGEPDQNGEAPEDGGPGDDGERMGPPPGAQAQQPADGAGPGRGPGRRGHGPGGPGGVMGGFGPGLAQRLGLDEAQQAQVQTLVAQAREAGAPAREQMNQLREQERALWSAGQVDEQALGELSDRMGSLASAERERQVDLRLAILQVLTPDQRARFAELPSPAERGPRGMGRGPGRGMDHRQGASPDVE